MAEARYPSLPGLVLCTLVLFSAAVNGSNKASEAPTGSPSRVLVPSALGNLGISYRDRIIVGLDIVPKGPRRRLFEPLKTHGRSEFVDEALGRISEYLAGARRNFRFELSLNDYDLEPLAVRTYVETLQIPYGETRTYQKLATAIGQPGSYRRVRSILVSNPIPVLIPCHRVVPRRGGVGSYIGGEKKKQWLIKMEARNKDAFG